MRIDMGVLEILLWTLSLTSYVNCWNGQNKPVFSNPGGYKPITDDISKLLVSPLPTPTQVVHTSHGKSLDQLYFGTNGNTQMNNRQAREAVAVTNHPSLTHLKAPTDAHTERRGTESSRGDSLWYDFDDKRPVFPYQYRGFPYSLHTYGGGYKYGFPVSRADNTLAEKNKRPAKTSMDSRFARKAMIKRKQPYRHVAHRTLVSTPPDDNYKVEVYEVMDDFSPYIDEVVVHPTAKPKSRMSAFQKSYEKEIDQINHTYKKDTTQHDTFKCPGNGLFYRDDVSFYSCAGSIINVQFCAPGTKNPQQAGNLRYKWGRDAAKLCSINIQAARFNKRREYARVGYGPL